MIFPLNAIGPRALEGIVTRAEHHSDRGVEGLTAFANVFIEAHRRNPGCLSVEVGTRSGGSALMFLQLLKSMYQEYPPCFFTVDPYGFKPYNGGDVSGAPLYGDLHYLEMKKNLSEFSNHVHFQMKSTDFFSRMRGLEYWRPGAFTAPVMNVSDMTTVYVPVGEARKAGNLAFCLLDGEHDLSTVDAELGRLFGGWMAKDGLVIVDNVDTDPKVRPMLEKWMRAEFSDNGQWAVVLGIR